MAFPTKLLNKDEAIILDLRPHWWRVVPASAGLAVSIIIGLFAFSTDNSAVRILAGILVLAAVGWFVQSYISWISENFVVTNERVIYRRGVVSKTGVEIPLERINTVFFKQSLFERLIGAGNLGVESAGEGGQQTFEAVRRPHDVQQEIYRAMESAETRTHQRQADAMASALGNQSQTAATIPEQIDQLDALRRQGTITDEEFEAKKRELLDRM